MNQPHFLDFRWQSTAALFLLAATSASADWISLTAQKSAAPAVGESAYAVDVIDSSSDVTTLRFQLNGFDASPLLIEGKTYTQIRVPGMSLTDEKAMPELPRLSQSVMMALRASGQIEVVSQESAQFKLGTVNPSKGTIYRNEDPARVPYRFASFYATPVSTRGLVFPLQSVSLSDSFQFRDITGANLAIQPFQYDFGTSELTVLKEAVIRVRSQIARGGVSAFISPEKELTAQYAKLYGKHFLNFAKGLENTREVHHVIHDTQKMLVVTHPKFKAGLTPFLEWKSKRGIEVYVVDTTQAGTTYTQIKDTIKKYYVDHQITTVLLVGDAEFVPFHPGTAGNAAGQEADPLYGALDGNDQWPEAMVGRFSVKDEAGLATIVNKSIAYEANPDVNGEWYAKGAGIASNEGSPTDWERVEELRTLMLNWHFTTVDKLYDPGVKPATVAASINEGRSYINYTGHGSTTSWGTSGFNVTNINSLNNGNRLPFIVSVACVNGHFSGSGESFAERWLLAGNAQTQKGAIAIYASSTNQSWVPPTVGQKAITEILVSGQMDTIGTLFTHGGIAVLEDASSTADQTFQTWHTFGDPTLQVRTQRPTAIVAQLPTVVDSHSSMLLMLDSDGLRVAISRGSEVLAVGTSDATRGAELKWTAAPFAAGKATITVSGFNRVPVSQEIELQ